MELYLATDGQRLQTALQSTAQLAHMSYRIGPEGTLAVLSPAPGPPGWPADALG